MSKSASPAHKLTLGSAKPAPEKPGSPPSLDTRALLFQADRQPSGGDASLPYRPTQVFNPAAQIMGDSASSEALRLLQEHTDHIKRVDTLVLLKEALISFKKGDWAGGGEFALKALHVDEKSGEAWHILAIARDKCNDYPTALTCYETALRLMPDNPAIANDLGRLAVRLSLNDLAEKFFRFFLAKCPGHVEAVNNLATVLREESRYEEAIELLRSAIMEHPEDSSLWNALGTVVNAQGDMENSATFYSEALRHNPNHVHALYNYGNTLSVIGDPQQALEYLHKALPLFDDPMNVHTCKLSIAFNYLILGDYVQGWEWYEARAKDNTAETLTYLIDRPHWTPKDPLKGKRVFVSAEQGLGDEIMFSGMLTDILREIGPDGHLGIGVEPRLVPLFQRSFPGCTVTRHHTTTFQSRPVRLFPEVTDWESYDYWATMGDFLSRYRRTLESFDVKEAHLKPDRERIAHWKRLLDGLNAKPKIGILWKSLIKHSRRDRYYTPFDQWKDILSLDGIQFVNLQYGDVDEELAQAKAMGLDIWTPPGIDLKADLDDLSALCGALDCVLGPSNATSNIAGAVGTPIWLVSPARSWTFLGTDRFPWYKNTRVFATESLLDWQPVMTDLREALVDTFIKGKA
jgi:tetratricopeptide (TPR) repeat protein